MPLIEREVIDPPVELKVKVKQSVLKRFESYANYMSSSQNYCVEKALELVMDKDRDFAQYEATDQEPKKRNKPTEIAKAS